ncbi:uncharacterized protein Z518_04536 [Rhinocladiella mackenziei CBS 650.93]|uniref:Presequence translocated-associated motor subunit PAM17 n=1 Tax=Rhinocladiella mackenziei CBS 650.93 TaxID=1442369 RepID=A0A0D2JBU0_9EURO|nr:uncharacterized protein Z518_04536 [Rhinocladiella mackenziei CBS 650.93]KIX06560.1 hypothetical protein Z518_04536 [Rhinocladiella mackenziei CBS 650.93]
MSSKATRLGLPLKRSGSFLSSAEAAVKSRRHISSAALVARSHQRRLPSSKSPSAAANPPSSTSTPSSFFTPSLCRIRNASTSTPPKTSSALDWNTFFRLRTSRRRYALTSSIVTSFASTAAAVIAFSEVPGFADNVTKLIPTDPFTSMGIATFGATFLGWLIGPAFGNSLWRLLHRSRLPEFTIKERGFFERIKKHRVNPSGASTNNPVPDFYGEKVGSVAGYRRWLKDQRAFNRKKERSYPSTT